MKLIKQHGRTYGDKDYFKYIIVLPNKIIEEIGWKGGEELNIEIKDNKLIIVKG